MDLGYLSVLEVNDEERDLYLQYLESSKDLDCLPFIDSLLGKDTLTFLDLFAGETIKIPSRQELIKILNYIIIYQYIKERGFTDEAYQKASSLFKRRVDNLQRIVEKVSNTIGNLK